MIKKILILFIALFLLGCTTNDSVESKVNEINNSEVEVKTEEESLISEDEKGNYREWYQGREQLKMEGRKDKNGNRIGIWKYYSPEGVELSVAMYQEGRKEGVSIVRYENGTIRYVGEYMNNQQVGEWKFYNENGELIETKSYPYPEE